MWDSEHFRSTHKATEAVDQPETILAVSPMKAKKPLRSLGI